MPPSIDQNDPDLRARVIAQFRAMAVGDVAPSINEWLRLQPPALPSPSWIRNNWGWSTITAEAGLRPSQNRPPTQATQGLDAPLGDQDRAWARAHFTPAELTAIEHPGLPVLDKPRVLDEQIITLGDLRIRRTVLAWAVR